MEVIVLAGGLGTRLRSVVHEIPKCLAPIGGKPFLGFLLDWLGKYPVRHVVFSVGYLREQVIDYVKSREWPFSYDFAIEEMPLGTGGGIRLALGKCLENQVFVVNGDTFFPVDLNAVSCTHPVTLALKPMKDFDRYGAVEIAGLAGNDGPSYPAPTGHLITRFHEKQHCDEGLINGGVYLLDRSRLDLSILPEKFSFEKEVLEPGAAIGEIGGWVSDAYFIDIGIPEDYRKAQWAIPAWFAVQDASEAVLKADATTLFLDRDGVLNRHLPGDYVRTPQMWEWMPGILQALARWAGKFNHIVLVTNQRGVGKGLMTDAQLAQVHAQMMQDILEAGGRIDLILTCTAVSEENPRRKPNPGMFYEACELFPDIDAKSSVMLGDSQSDAAFANNCGIRFILLNPEAVS
jgi:D-glycero-alpha-D-manno-heptose 1-phosphate guanylyltransferase